MKYTLFRIARPILTLYMKAFYRVTIINRENIPLNGPGLLIGNHTNELDSLLIISSTKRTLRFLAKKEIFKPIIGKLFENAGVIKVDRSTKNKKALDEAKKALENKELVVLFPEGTINRTNDIIMPFKYGAVSLAHKTKAPLIPFIIKGKYKLFKKEVTLEILKPYFIECDDLTKENEKLMNKVKEGLIK